MLLNRVQDAPLRFLWSEQKTTPGSSDRFTLKKVSALGQLIPLALPASGDGALSVYYAAVDDLPW